MPTAMLISRLNRSLLVLLGGLCLAANAQSPAGGPRSIERVRHLILHSRNLGITEWAIAANP